MRRSAALLAVLAAPVPLLIALSSLSSESDDGCAAGTRNSATSPDGDVATTASSRARRAPRARGSEPFASDEDAPDPEPSCAGPPPAVRALRIVDPCGQPIEDVEVEPGDRRTDEDGRVSFAVESAEDAPLEVSFFDGRTTRRVALGERETQVAAEHFPLLDVQVVDASTGRAVDARWIDVALGGSPGSHATRLDAGRALPFPVSADRTANVFVRVEPSDGFATVNGFTWSGSVTAAARRARLVVPVWPVCDVAFRSVDATGAPVDGAEVVNVAVRATWRAESSDGEQVLWMPRVRAISEPSGVVVVRGLPRLAACGVTVRVEGPADRDGQRLAGALHGLRLDATDGTAQFEIRLLPPAPYRRGRPMNVPPDSREPQDPPPPPDEPDAPERFALTVTVIRRGGACVPGVEVRAGGVSARTDAAGRARLEVPRGRVEFAAAADGFLASSRVVELLDERELTIVEPEPHRASVCVVDADGRRVAGARVTASVGGVSVPQMDGDVQVLTPRTGPDGCVRMEVPPGRVRYAATLAGAFAEIESEDDEVVVTLRSP